MKLIQTTNPVADTNPMRENNSRKAWKYLVSHVGPFGPFGPSVKGCVWACTMDSCSPPTCGTSRSCVGPA